MNTGYISKIAALIFVLTISIFSQTENPFVSLDKFDPQRDPSGDLKLAVNFAEPNNKRIILDVGGEWCIWCHRLDAFIQSHERIKNLIDQNFVWAKINYSKENKNEKFLSAYPEIPGFPHLFVLEKDGSFLHSQDTGVLEQDKDYSEEKILTFLNEWLPKREK
jgi:thioredoxin-related protein